MHAHFRPPIKRNNAVVQQARVQKWRRTAKATAKIAIYCWIIVSPNNLLFLKDVANVFLNINYCNRN